MIDFRELPDIEAILIAYLLTADELVDLVEDRISTELPDNFTAEARVQLFRNGGTPVDGGTESIDRPLVQVNAFGATKGEAFDVAKFSLRALQRAQFANLEDAELSDTERLTGPAWSPDPPTDIPRYITTMAFTIHSL